MCCMELLGYAVCQLAVLQLLGATSSNTGLESGSPMGLADCVFVGMQQSKALWCQLLMPMMILLLLTCNRLQLPYEQVQPGAPTQGVLHIWSRYTTSVFE